MDYPFDRIVAIDRITGLRVPAGTMTVYAESDIGRTTPLSPKDPTGQFLAGGKLIVNSESYVPDFVLEDVDRAVGVSGINEVVLVSTHGYKIAAETAAAAAQDAEASASQAAAAAGADAVAEVETRIAAGEFTGPQGKSAYQLAVDAGFVGTEAEWRESLRGLPGPDAIPADEAVASYATTPGTATATALSATYGDVVVKSHGLPAGLGWSTDSKVAVSPKLTSMRGGRLHGSAGVEPKALFARFSTAQANPVNRFYAAPNGNDTNAGTYAAPFRSIKKCIEAANAGGQTARILVTAGSYMNGHGFEGVSPTVDVAFVSASGPVLVSTGMQSSGYTFAAHATYTKTYYVNPTPGGGVSRVLDLTRVTEFGHPVELVKVANETVCNETPDSYYEGSALYIHRADGAQPTFTNTRVLVTAPNLVVTSAVNVYLGSEDGSPWTIEGSANVQTSPPVDPGVAVFAVAAASNTALKAIVGEAVMFRFGGEQLATTAANGVTADRWNGITAFFNCGADANAKDGFNLHNGLNDATTPLALTVNCAGRDNGRKAQSANGLTMHENVIAIDIAGRYVRGRGGTVHNIGTSKQYLLGTYVEGDLGDVAAGGNIPPTGIMLQNSAQLWAERVSVQMPPATFGYWAKDTNTKFYRKDCEPTAQPDAGQGTFGTF